MEKINAMSRDDPDYLERRAEAQLELAQSATDPRAVQVHYQLANSYLDLIYGEERGDANAASAPDIRGNAAP